MRLAGLSLVCLFAGCANEPTVVSWSVAGFDASGRVTALNGRFHFLCGADPNLEVVIAVATDADTQRFTLHPCADTSRRFTVNVTGPVTVTGSITGHPTYGAAEWHEGTWPLTTVRANGEAAVSLALFYPTEDGRCAESLDDDGDGAIDCDDGDCKNEACGTQPIDDTDPPTTDTGTPTVVTPPTVGAATFTPAHGDLIDQRLVEGLAGERWLVGLPGLVTRLDADGDAPLGTATAWAVDPSVSFNDLGTYGQPTQELYAVGTAMTPKGPQPVVARFPDATLAAAPTVETWIEPNRVGALEAFALDDGTTLGAVAGWMTEGPATNGVLAKVDDGVVTLRRAFTGASPTTFLDIAKRDLGYVAVGSTWNNQRYTEGFVMFLDEGLLSVGQYAIGDSGFESFVSVAPLGGEAVVGGQAGGGAFVARAAEAGTVWQTNLVHGGDSVTLTRVAVDGDRVLASGTVFSGAQQGEVFVAALDVDDGKLLQAWEYGDGGDEQGQGFLSFPGGFAFAAKTGTSAWLVQADATTGSAGACATVRDATASWSTRVPAVTEAYTTLAPLDLGLPLVQPAASGAAALEGLTDVCFE